MHARVLLFGVACAMGMALAVTTAQAAVAAPDGDRVVPSSVRVGEVEVPVLATFSGRSTNVTHYEMVRGAIHGVRRIEGATVLYASVGFPEDDLLGALFPPLAPGTSTVTIEFPGLEPLTDVPVTRL